MSDITVEQPAKPVVSPPVSTPVATATPRPPFVARNRPVKLLGDTGISPYLGKIGYGFIVLIVLIVIYYVFFAKKRSSDDDESDDEDKNYVENFVQKLIDRQHRNFSS